MFRERLRVVYWTSQTRLVRMGCDKGATCLNWVNMAPHRGRHQRGNGRRKRLRRRRWMAVILLMLSILVGVIYYVFFRAYDVGPRTVSVNGEDVEQLPGLSIHSTTWLASPQVHTLLQHIHATGVAVPEARKTYRGVSYISGPELVQALTRYGDSSNLSDGHLAVALKSHQHYSYQAAEGTVFQQRIVVNGQRVGAVLALRHNEAVYIPAGTVSRLLAKANFPSSWNGQSINLALTAKPTPTPVQRPSEDGVIAFGPGDALFAPKYLWRGETYLPVFSLSAALRRLGVTAKLGTWQWTVIYNANTNVHRIRSSSKPDVLAFVPFYGSNLAPFNDVLSHESVYNAMAADTWTVDPSGSLNGSAPVGTTGEASAAGDTVYAMVTNLDSSGFNAKEMTSILGSPSRSNQLRTEIVSAVAAGGFDGAMLDFEMISVTDRGAYSDFVARLAAALHAEGKKLEVAVPADTGSDSEPWNQGYDQARLGAAADGIVVMAYDYSYEGSPAGPIAPLPWVQQSLAYTVSRVPAEKVVLAIDTYGYDWSGKSTTAVSLTSVNAFLAAHHIQPRWDATAQAPWYQWNDSKGALHTVYYENGQSTAGKLQLSALYGIKGVAIWRAGLEDAEVNKALGKYAGNTQP